MKKGFDILPLVLKKSKYLTGFQLHQLADISSIPAVDPGFEDIVVENTLALLSGEAKYKRLFQHAGTLLDKGKLEEAWQVLLRNHMVRDGVENNN